MKFSAKKLNHYGVRGNVNKLIKSCLANRKQYVLLNGIDSEKKNIDSGVPQGSFRDLFYF